VASAKQVPNEAEMAVIEQMRAMRRECATYRAIGAVTGHGPMSVSGSWTGSATRSEAPGRGGLNPE
jgi:hypothetical protein